MRAKRRASIESDLYPLIEASYEAATQPEAWNDFLELLCEAIGADAGALHIYDSSSARGSLGWWRGVPDAVVTEYPNWSTKNPHMAAFAGRVVTGMITANSLVRRAEYLRSEYHNEFMRYHLPLYAATGCCIYSGGPLNVVISADRLAKRSEFAPAVEGAWQLLLPHLQRAVAIWRKLGNIDLSRNATMDILDRLDSGVILLSANGVVLTVNETARILISEDDGLKITRDGQLAALGRECAKLDALIKAACASTEELTRSGGSALAVSRKSGRSSLEIVVAPLRLRQFMLTCERPSAVVFIRDPERLPPRMVRLQELYGLTPAEARVAQRLVGGSSVDELAAALKVTVATARTHIRHLLEKIGARGISDLTRRLAGLPPVR